MHKRVKPERIAERNYMKWARKVKKALVRKVNGLGYKSWPDVWTIPLTGIDFLIEFKRVGEEPTELQDEMHKQLKRRGKVVFVCCTLEQAQEAYRLCAKSKPAEFIDEP